MTTAQAALVVSVCVGFVALFGAVNAYRALQWQKRRDAERRRTSARVEFEQSMSFGPRHGDPSETVTVEGLFRRKGRSRIAVMVLNDSEEAAIFVRDITVYGVTTGEGTPLMFEEGDVRLEPRERLVRLLEVEDEDVEEFRDNGFAARVMLSTGETIEARDKLVDDFLNFNLTSGSEGDLR